LKFKVVDHEHDRREEDHEWCPEDTKYDYHRHMAHAVRSFWGKGQELCQQVVNIKGFSGS
jgi:hypothetical protein